MSRIEQYLSELREALQVRGAQRRRFLRECADHLADACAERGEQAAVAAFGSPREIAATFDAQVASRRTLRATGLTAAAVAGMGISTLVLIHAAAPGARAPGVLAAVFFLSAQLAGLAASAGILRALVVRRSAAAPGELLVLCRRNALALSAAIATMLSAGIALPGHGSPVALLAGPAVLGAAAAALLRARRLAARLDPDTRRPARPLFDDLATLCGARLPGASATYLPALATAAAATLAYGWARGEHAANGGALTVAAIEALAAAACIAVLGPGLGLRPRR